MVSSAANNPTASMPHTPHSPCTRQILHIYILIPCTIDKMIILLLKRFKKMNGSFFIFVNYEFPQKFYVHLVQPFGQLYNS